MKKEIKIFKSFEEQEKYHFEKMCNTTVHERFQILFSMQKWSELFHKSQDQLRKIIIGKNGHS